MSGRFEADGVNLRDNYLGLMRAIREKLKEGCEVTQLMGMVDEPKLRSSAPWSTERHFKAISL